MTPIAHSPLTAIDCPDPAALADFYAAVLGWSVMPDSDDEWVTIGPGSTEGLAFQRVEGYSAPEWPHQEHPQQMHLDLTVADLDEGEAAVLALGARKHDFQPGTTFRVFLDPVGHPFCLCAE